MFFTEIPNCRFAGMFMSAVAVTVIKPERKKPLGRPRSRWEDNIRMDLEEIR
jgi:hypothetical protein